MVSTKVNLEGQIASLMPVCVYPMTPTYSNEQDGFIGCASTEAQSGSIVTLARIGVGFIPTDTDERIAQRIYK